MKSLDTRLRAYERAADLRVLPGVFPVVRIDGRGFTRLTKEALPLERPFDPRFRALMEATARHLMRCGFRAVFAYAQSDEISLLLHRGESAYGRSLRKWVSVLAGEASACFSAGLRELGFGEALGAFDARVCPLPAEETVVDYFRWRARDAFRNAVGAHAYWALRGEGMDAREATRRLEAMGNAERQELLFRRGTNVDALPGWQKRGLGLWWVEEARQATNPKTGEAVTATRRRLRVEEALPRGEAFAELVRARVAEARSM